ncbi:sigma-70 family RNA polymerase sigma factor, partial [Dactylosporangium sp. NPDC005572]|uniref:sigma-70 family RNA polymerase sigma factor n=1 Tax=Dactylosporangium sp. NPDC005572 TaxID=3156889 RepID=UPI0033B44FEF
MSGQDWLSERFAEHRERLQAVAYRMLRSPSDAEDAVQEAWLRVSRADTSQVENPAGWLTTIVARVCLTMLESRRTRRDEPAGELSDAAVPHAGATPEDEALLADAVGVALMVVLDTLTPAERLAFVLHDVFGVSFGEIAPIIDRTPTAARQLASRARRRVQGAAAASDAARSRKRELVAAFLAASRGGDFDALVALLDPNAVTGGVRGAQAVVPLAVAAVSAAHGLRAGR